MKRLMKRLLRLLILLPLALAAVALAVANRQNVAIYLDPFAGATPEGLQITVPLFVVIFVAVMIGVILGSFATYFEQGKYRRAARRVRREVDALQKEIARCYRGAGKASQ